MFRKLATLVGYKKAPKATFMLRHPVKGYHALAAAKGLPGGSGTRRATLSLGAAAVVVPLGIWLIMR